MAKTKRSRSKQLIMDVGTSAVRVCELTPTKTGYQLTKYFHREFPIEPTMDEEEQRTIRRDVVRDLLKESKIRHKKTVFGVPGQSVFTRTRALPPVPEYKVTQIVRYEIQQQIPFSLDQIAFDYQVLQRTEAGGYDVLMAAIKVDVVEKRLEVIRDVKRQVDTVDVCPLSAYNWLKYTGEFGEQGDCVALLDLGAATTDIVIERENQFRFTRSLNLGGNDITSAIAAEFGATFAEAEKIKRERGFAPSGDPQRDGKGGEVIGRVLNRLVSEISRSFAYFRSQPGGGPVSRIIVTGGGACLRNIIPFLQRQLGIEVRIAQPLAGLAIAPGAQEVNEHPEQAAVALGLALRCCEPVTIGVNLIPPRILEAAKHKEQIVYWALSVTTLALIVASIIPVLAQKNKAVLEQIEYEKTAISQYDPRVLRMPGDPQTWKSPYEAQLKEARDQITTYENKVATLDNHMKLRRQWINYLVEINDQRPRGQLLLIWSIESTLLLPSIERAQSGERRSPLSNLQAQGGIRAGGLAPPPLKYTSSGFKGIEPPVGGAASGGGSFLGSRQRNPINAGAGSREDENKPWVMPPGTLKYNGITVQGFAGSMDTILEFVENLKKSKMFVEGGVFYDDRFTDPLAVTALDDAWSSAPTANLAASNTGRTGLGGFGGGGSSRARREEGGGFGNLSGRFLGGGGARAGGGGANTVSASLWGQQGVIYPFRIDLQFEGVPADKAKPSAEQIQRQGLSRERSRDRTRYD